MIHEQQRVILLGDGVELNREQVLDDYRVGWVSRQVSLIGRREVLTGKAKFGIFGDGKEVPQLAMAHAFRPGTSAAATTATRRSCSPRACRDLRSTSPSCTPTPTSTPSRPPAAGPMNAHFATRFLNADGTWRQLVQHPNSSADLSPTGSQMPRLVGLAYASVLYRELPELHPPGPLVGSRQRDRLRHHRQRHVRRGHVLGGRSTPSACWAARRSCLDLGRRLRHLGAQRHPDHQGQHLGAAGRLPARPRATRRLRPVLRAWLGLSGPGGGLPPRRPQTRAASTCRPSSTLPSSPSPRATRTSGSHERYKGHERLAWEEEMRLPAADAALAAGRGHCHARGLGRHRGPGLRLRRGRARGGLAGLLGAAAGGGGARCRCCWTAWRPKRPRRRSASPTSRAA